MDKATASYRMALLLLLATLALRAVIPIGYMPGSFGGELLLELCPDGVPIAMIQALSGDHHHHGDGSDETKDAIPDQCQTGHILTSAAFSPSIAIALEPPDTPVFNQSPGLVAIVAAPVAYLSRAPPVIA
jgi:hypothetical protein